MDKRNCLQCGKPFLKPVNVSKRNWAEKHKCCSISCARRYSGTPWLTDHRFKPGVRANPNGEFTSAQTSGDKNTNWKGDKASYFAIHMWVSSHYGRPSECEHCGTTVKRMYNWANISQQYKRDRSDWKRLCVSCHKKYDLTKERV